MAKSPKTEKTQIYRLLDPITKEIKYIGKTDIPLFMRLVGHINQIYRKERFSDKGDWIEDLIKQGRCPLIELIEEVNPSEVKEREKYWVKYYSKFSKLYNIQYNDNKELAKSLHERGKKAIYEYDVNGMFLKEWDCIFTAANFYNIDSGNICYAANGKRKLAGNKMWRYYKKDKIPNYFKNKFVKPVHKYDLQGNYIESYESARDIKDVSFKIISKCCLLNATAYGFRYSYEKFDKLPPLIRKDKVTLSKEKKEELFNRILVGEVIKNIEKEYNVSRTTIYKILRIFTKSEEEVVEILKKQPKNNNMLKLTDKIKKQIISIYLTLPKPKFREKHKIYQKIADDFGLSPESVRTVINNYEKQTLKNVFSLETT